MTDTAAFRSPAEIAAFNLGVRSVLLVVDKAREQIATSSKRSQLFREIAGAAFEQLAEDGAHLLLPIDQAGAKPAGARES